jgi:hypothetical protein
MSIKTPKVLVLEKHVQKALQTSHVLREKLLKITIRNIRLIFSSITQNKQGKFKNIFDMHKT